MRKTVARRQNPIGQFLLPARLNQPVIPGQVGELLFHLQIAALEQFGEHRRKKFFALHASVLQRAAVGGIERLALLADHGADSLGDLQVHGAQRPRQPPMGVGMGDIAAVRRNSNTRI